MLFIAEQVWELAKHRVYGDINAAIDANSAKYLQHTKPYILYLVTNPLLVSLLAFIGLVFIIVVHAYVDTLRSTTEEDNSHAAGGAKAGAREPAPKLIIKSALYGVGNYADEEIADRLNSKTKDALAFYVNNNLISGLPDPAPNLPPGKKLQVSYLFGGDPKPRTAIRNEHEFMVLPEDPKIEQLRDEIDGLTKQLRAARAPATVIVGLTTDNVELEPAPNWTYKFKLRIYWTNDGDQQIHIGKPTWKPLGMGIQGDQLAYRFEVYQGGQGKRGPEVLEADVFPGQRCRIWIGLDPTSSEIAEHLLDTGKLGVLVLPITTANGTVELRIRPRDRALKSFNASEYLAQKKVVTDGFTPLDHGAKEALRLLLLMKAMTAQAITDHLVKWKFPKAERIVDDLRNASVPFIVSLGRSEFQINPTLEKIIKEVSTTDQSDFLKAIEQMPAEGMRRRAENEPGFAERYEVLSSFRQPS